MTMELIKNNLYAIRLKGRKEILRGIFLGSGVEWILLKYNPVDYVLDGYLLIRKKYIKNIIREEKEKFKETVIRLKCNDTDFDITSPKLDEIIDTLYYLMQHETVIQLEFHDESVCYIGKIRKIFNKTMRMLDLDTKGNWENECSYQIEQIRTIQFDNDYTNSLDTYNKWLNRQIPNVDNK